MANPNPRTDHLSAFQWKPGESGNPGGRPKGLNLTAILSEVLEGKELCGETVPGNRTVATALVESVLAHAIKRGDASLVREILARIDGPSEGKGGKGRDNLDDPQGRPKVVIYMPDNGRGDGLPPTRFEPPDDGNTNIVVEYADRPL